jgi:hypothetical protein
MIREIINTTDAILTVRLPEDLVGKTIQLIAFEIDPTQNNVDKPTREDRLRKIEELTRPYLTDLSKFKFDRNEANNYDE